MSRSNIIAATIFDIYALLRSHLYSNLHINTSPNDLMTLSTRRLYYKYMIRTKSHQAQLTSRYGGMIAFSSDDRRDINRLVRLVLFEFFSFCN